MPATPTATTPTATTPIATTPIATTPVTTPTTAAPIATPTTATAAPPPLRLPLCWRVVLQVMGFVNDDTAEGVGHVSLAQRLP